MTIAVYAGGNPVRWNNKIKKEGMVEYICQECALKKEISWKSSVDNDAQKNSCAICESNLPYLLDVVEGKP